jgi:signal transduction histidine kinase
MKLALMATTVDSNTIRNIRQSLHSLAQPLAVLTGLVDLLLLELDQADPTLQEVRQISEQLEKVLRIVGEIHRLVRETLPAEPVNREPWAHPKP